MERSAKPVRGVRSALRCGAGAIRHGTHICAFYETDQDLLDLVTQFCSAGARRGDLCLWMMPEGADSDALASAGVEIHFWGVAWPHVPGLKVLLQGTDARDFKGSLEEIHGSPLVWSMIALIVLHVAGAVKHQFDGAPILWRMAPWMKRPA